MGSVGSVQFQIVPCFSLYFFSRSIGPFQNLVNVNYMAFICCPCHFQSGSLFFFLSASSVCKSLKCLISALTQGGEGGLLFRFSGVMGREKHCKQISLLCVGSACTVWNTQGLPQLMVAYAFRVYTAQYPGCSAGSLSKAGPAFHALPRSKPLRFSGTLQGHRLCWVCVFVPFPRSEQLRRPGVW